MNSKEVCLENLISQQTMLTSKSNKGVIMNRKIATSVSVRINVGNYQHIEISKYSESEIEFNTTEERIKLEDGLHEEIVSDLIRNMRILPEKLGKKTDSVTEFEESVKKQVPNWMRSNIEPNIAKENFNKINAESKSKLIEEEKEVESIILGGNTSKESSVSKATKEFVAQLEPIDDVRYDMSDESHENKSNNGEERAIVEDDIGGDLFNDIEDKSHSIEDELKNDKNKDEVGLELDDSSLMEFDDDDLFD